MRKTVPEKLERARIVAGPAASRPDWGFYGAFQILGPCGRELRIVASGADDDDKASDGWEHVSVSLPNRPPNWQEMCYAKSLFWEDEECVIQFHPPRSRYVNNHPYCLHLWKKRGDDFLMPPPILVGDPTVGELRLTSSGKLIEVGND